MTKELCYLPWKGEGEQQLRGGVIIGKALVREAVGPPGGGIYHWGTGLVVQTSTGQAVFCHYDKPTDALTAQALEGFLVVEEILDRPTHT